MQDSACAPELHTPTLDDWLSLVSPRLSPILDDTRQQYLSTVARRLPANALGILELRLGHRDAPIDLALRIDRLDIARELAADQPHPILSQVIADWSDPKGDFLRSVGFLWLEYDLDRPPTLQTVPSIFAAVKPRVSARWIIDRLVPALQATPPSPAQKEFFNRCHRAVPPGASIVYVGKMLSRPNQTFRVNVGNMPPEEIRRYIHTVAPQRDLTGLDRLLDLARSGERLQVAFDVGESLEDRIGVECAFAGQPPREEGWSRRLDELVEHGLCDPTVREAVLSWPGRDTVLTSPSQWPDAAPLDACCMRAFSHLKYVCDENGALEAKLYLLFGLPESRLVEDWSANGSPR